jgi:hypothetical protein
LDMPPLTTKKPNSRELTAPGMRILLLRELLAPGY